MKYYGIAPILLSLFLMGCSSSPVSQREATPPPKSNDQLIREVDHLKSTFSTHAQKSIAQLHIIAQKHGNSSAGLDASRFLGDYYYRNKKHNEALAYYNPILQNNYLEPFETSVSLNVTNIYREANLAQKAYDTLNRTLSYAGLSTEDRLLLLNAKLDILKSYQDITAQLEVLGTMYNIATRPSDKESIRARATTLTDSITRPQDIENILGNSRLEFVHASLYFRLGSISFEKSDFSSAKSYFSKVVSLNPDSEYAEASREYLQQLDARFSVDSKTVGVILPLSGKYSDIGRSVLNSLQLGLGIYDRQSNIRLAVIDSEGKFLDARRAVEKLVVEDKVIAIIGSLQSKSAAAVSSKAQSLGVPTVVLSQKSGLTDIGPYVFRNALTSEMQVEHLVRVAREEKGITRFAILYPDDSYGTEYANIFWSAVERQGGQVRAAQSYDPKETDFRATLQKLVGVYYTDDRQAEFKTKMTEWQSKHTKKSARDETPQDLLAPLVDFEALFIPDSTKALGQISAMLSFLDVKDISLLGTNLWNTSGVAERAGRFSQNTIFVDTFLKDDPLFMQSPVVREFQEKFGRVPTSFDIQAYDTALVLKKALASSSSRAELQNELSQLSSFKGSLTSLSMLPSRDLSRPIVTLTIKDGQIVLYSQDQKKQ